jgi:cobalt-zinc-cadmium resistance protein CzcA
VVIGGLFTSTLLTLLLLPVLYEWVFGEERPTARKTDGVKAEEYPAGA